MLVGEVSARMALDSKQYEKGLDRLEGKTQKKALTLGSIFKGAFSFALGIGVVQGFRSLTGAVTDFVNTAARTDVLNIAMQSVARSSGYATAAVREHKDAIMELGIAEQEATQITTRFIQAQLDTADAARIARTAQDAAVIAGTNSSEAALKMTEAVAKLRPELLEEFGMTKNLNAIYADYAKTIGKTVQQLTETEKKQAMLNYILAEGEKIAGTYEASMGAVGKQIGSLPRYWDTLKNALAKPLAIPAVSVIVDGITNGLINAIRWAEENARTLQHWGQTAANVASFVIRAFKYVGQVFAENWAMIKIAATTLITYAVATRAAAGATALFQTVSLLLSGNLTVQSGILGTLSNLIVYYKVQMLEATVATNIFSGALLRLRAMLIAVHTVLGPVGWVLLAISAAVGVGTHLWSKYTQSLQQTTQAAKSFRELEESTKGAATATEEQADALEEAGKAAGKNLQSFDEVHQLQEDMAGSADDMLDALDMQGLDADLPGLNIDEVLAGIEEGLEAVKPTLAGFWEWIKQGAGNVWEGVKEKWNGFWGWVQSWGIWTWFGDRWEGIKNFVGGIWEGVKEKWSTFWEWVKSWGIWQWIADRWDGLKEWAGNVWDGAKEKWEGFKSWVGSWAGPLWDGIKEKWAGFKEWAGNMWDGAKDKWGNFTDWVGEKWSNFRTKAGEIWEGVKTTVQSKWEDLKTNAPVIWEDIKTNIQTRWDTLKTGASEAWSNITTTIGTKWDELKTKAPTVWENIKTNISNRWDSLVTGASEKWGNIKTTISTRWEELKTEAPTTWENIKKNISDRWEALKTEAPITWENVRKTITEKWDELKTNVGPTWNSIKTTIAEKWEEIKKDAFNWGKNLIDSFVDGIKNRFEALKSGLLNIGTAIKEALLGEGTKSSDGGGKGGGGGGGSTLADQKQASTEYYAANKEAIDKIAKEKGVDLGVAASMHKVSVPKLATGTNYVPQDMLAYLHEGEAVVPKAYNPAASGMSAEQIEQAMYRAFINAIRVIQASSQQSDEKELVLKIDNTVLARMQLPALTREAQRQGFDLLIRPQGV